MPDDPERKKFLDSELTRMKQRAFEERFKQKYDDFVARELEKNGQNRLSPRFHKAWDKFHEDWARKSQVKKLPGTAGQTNKEALVGATLFELNRKRGIKN
jgi:hypothetical protein